MDDRGAPIQTGPQLFPEIIEPSSGKPLFGVKPRNAGGINKQPSLEYQNIFIWYGVAEISQLSHIASLRINDVKLSSSALF